MIGLILNHLCLQWRSGYSDSFAWSRGCHCKRGHLYWWQMLFCLAKSNRNHIIIPKLTRFSNWNIELYSMFIAMFLRKTFSTHQHSSWSTVTSDPFACSIYGGTNSLSPPVWGRPAVRSGHGVGVNRRRGHTQGWGRPRPWAGMNPRANAYSRGMDSRGTLTQGVGSSSGVLPFSLLYIHGLLG